MFAGKLVYCPPSVVMEYLVIIIRVDFPSLLLHSTHIRLFIKHEVFRSHTIHPSALKNAYSKDTGFLEVKFHMSVFKCA